MNLAERVRTALTLFENHQEGWSEQLTLAKAFAEECDSSPATHDFLLSAGFEQNGRAYCRGLLMVVLAGVPCLYLSHLLLPGVPTQGEIRTLLRLPLIRPVFSGVEGPLESVPEAMTC